MIDFYYYKTTIMIVDVALSDINMASHKKAL